MASATGYVFVPATSLVVIRFLVYLICNNLRLEGYHLFCLQRDWNICFFRNQDETGPLLSSSHLLLFYLRQISVVTPSLCDNTYVFCNEALCSHLQQTLSQRPPGIPATWATQLTTHAFVIYIAQTTISRFYNGKNHEVHTSCGRGRAFLGRESCAVFWAFFWAYDSASTLASERDFYFLFSNSSILGLTAPTQSSPSYWRWFRSWGTGWMDAVPAWDQAYGVIGGDDLNRIHIGGLGPVWSC
jgi:hypothetical protein